MLSRLKILLRSRAAKASVAAGAIALGCGGSYAVLAYNAAPARDAAGPISPATAQVLMTATNGPESVRVAAVGQEAQAINAALPFSRGPIAAARPFLISGSGSDEQRALLCLTQAVYYEAGYEPLLGRRAVAQVVLNRTRHPAFPKSICGVVYQGAGTGICQFTFVCDGALTRAPEARAWRQARLIAEAALSGFVEAGVGQSTHYHADYVTPRWAPLLTKVAQIGAHIFYRWPGAWGQPRAFNGRYIGEPSDPAALRPRLVVASMTSDDASLAVSSGPPVRRAPNDVGGLLDTSKGWTLRIPDPREVSSVSSRVIADQQQQPKAVAPVSVASAAVPLSAAR